MLKRKGQVRPVFVSESWDAKRTVRHIDAFVRGQQTANYYVTSYLALYCVYSLHLERYQAVIQQDGIAWRYVSCESGVVYGYGVRFSVRLRAQYRGGARCKNNTFG